MALTKTGMISTISERAGIDRKLSEQSLKRSSKLSNPRLNPEKMFWSAALVSSASIKKKYGKAGTRKLDKELGHRLYNELLRPVIENI